MVIFTDSTGHECGTFAFSSVDIDLNVERDFEIVVEASDYTNEITVGSRIFKEKSEFGGIVGGIKTDTEDGSIMFKGKTWRGYIASKVIEPLEGTAYRTVTGDFKEIMENLIEECGLSGLFIVGESDFVTEAYQFKRYINLLDGITELLKTKGHKLKLNYVQGERGEAGKVCISSSLICDLSKELELSQDNRLNFVFETSTNTTNHLICLGKGELENRTVVHLYIQADGAVGRNKHYTGLSEFTEVYENANAESEESLVEEGSKELLELHGKRTTFDMDIEELTIDVDIGDIVGGRDYITGLSLAKPVKNKILKIKNGIETVEYKLEE